MSSKEILSAFDALSHLPKDVGHYGVLYNSAHEDFVTFNLKCLTEGSEDDDEGISLPPGSVLDKLRDYDHFAKQRPYVLKSEDTEKNPRGKFNDIEYIKEEDNDENESKRGAHLDGTLSIDKLFVCDDEDSEFESGEYSIFFKKSHFDLTNKYIGSASPDERSEGRNVVGGFGIDKFFHESDEYRELFALGQPKTKKYDTKRQGPTTLINSYATLKTRIHNVGGGVIFKDWDLFVNAQDELDKWDWSIWGDDWLKDTSDEYAQEFEWYFDPWEFGLGCNADADQPFVAEKRKARERDFEAETAERLNCFDKAFDQWSNRYINPNHQFDPINEALYITPLGNFFNSNDLRDEVNAVIGFDNDGDCELVFCNNPKELLEVPDGGRPDGLELFNSCISRHCKKNLFSFPLRPTDVCGCGTDSPEYEGPCHFDVLCTKEENPGDGFL